MLFASGVLSQSSPSSTAISAIFLISSPANEASIIKLTSTTAEAPGCNVHGRVNPIAPCVVVVGTDAASKISPAGT